MNRRSATCGSSSRPAGLVADLPGLIGGDKGLPEAERSEPLSLSGRTGSHLAGQWVETARSPITYKMSGLSPRPGACPSGEDMLLTFGGAR